MLATVSNPESDDYLGDDPGDHQELLEDRDYYTHAKQPGIGQLIDRAPVVIENENSTLRGKLDKR